MEELRISLWSRLVVFYSVNKRDQLNPEVMAEIVAKYGSKEKELSARLLKKYGRPLPLSVPAPDLRRVLLEFGMEDQDVAGGTAAATATAAPAEPAAPAAAATAAADMASGEGAGQAPTAAAVQQERGQGQGPEQGHGERQAERPPRGSELDFRSRFFDPLKALHHGTLRPPFPRERALDNLAKFARIMPKLRTATTATATATATAGGAAAAAGAEEINPPPPTAATPKHPPAAAAAGATSGASHGIAQPGVQGRVARDTAAARRDRSLSAAPRPAALPGGGSVSKLLPAGKPEGGTTTAAVGGGGQASRRRGPGESGVGGSVGGHYGPPVGSAAELERMDKERASKRRNAELLLAGGAAGSAVPDEGKFTPVQRIMQEYAGKGPYSLLYRLHEGKRRANVMIRRVNSIRGTCSGLIRAFDRHMNLLLVDVREDYTAFVPDREPKLKPPRSKRQDRERRLEGAPPNPLRGGTGTGTTRVEEGEEGPRGSSNPAHVGGDTGSVTAASGSGVGVGGEGGEASVLGGGGGGGGSGWSGGGSVSWGRGGGSGVEEEAEGISHSPRRGVAAREAGAGESVVCADELGTGGGGSGGDRGAGGQGSFGHPPVEGGGSGGGQDGGGASSSKDGGKKKKSTRRSRGRGPWTGELVPVRRRRFLKQLMIRGDNVVMIWESPTP